MATPLALRVALVAVVLGLGVCAGACSGSDSPPVDDAGAAVDSGGGMLDAGSRDAGPPDAGGPGDASGGGSDAGFDAAVPIDAGSDAGDVDAGPCPDINGRYDLALSGAGCGDLSMTPTQQRIDGNTSTCVYRPEFDGTSMGVGGSLTLMADGTFTGATIMLGSGSYTCDGSFNSTTSVLRLMCMAAAGGGGACNVTMTRTGPL